MNKKFRLIGLLALIITLTACGTSNLIDKNISDLKSNAINKENISKLENVKPSNKDYLLNMQELGRISFIRGYNTESIKYLRFVADKYRYMEEDSNLRGVSSTALASTFANDNSIPYKGSDYERALVHFYIALAQLKQTSLDKAIIDVRATAEIQKLTLAKKEKEIIEANTKGAKEEINQYKISGDALAAINESKKFITNVKQGFMNPYIYYISGNIRELYGDINGALVDYKLALEVNSSNLYLVSDALRLSSFNDFSYYTTLKKNHSSKEIGQQAYKSNATVLVVYEQGFVPAKEPIESSVFILGNFYSIALPRYSKQQEKLSNVEVVVSASENIVGRAKGEEIANIYTLAQAELASQYKAILARQAGRIISKAALQATGSAALKNTDSSVAAIVGVGLYATGALTSLAEQADLRSFRTLPSSVQVAKLSVASAVDNVTVFVNSKEIKLDNLSLKQGELGIVYIIDTGSAIYNRVVYKTNN